MREKLVIWGAAGHAIQLAGIVRLEGAFDIVGFLDNVSPERRGTQFCGSSILGGVEQLDILREHGVTRLLLGFGNCAARLRAAEFAHEKGFRLATAIHPDSTIAPDVRIPDGTVVGAGSVISPASQIGGSVIVNTAATVGHQDIIGDGAHIGPGAHLGGGVTVGVGTWIGIGAIVIDHVSIGGDTVIGAGAVVVRSIPDHVVAYGNPATVRRRTS